ncbi:hypothetical protein [Legionella quateirensis]|uniref:Uncharacterized protein n=1 Tax=Legionella quateirensis TaxID=45072 RepID=A0A378KWU5_9GAMM|nr:hypothetical protein [Legionella quateirensis]KTD44830.1 hypothetical protein Lqua_2665 [Legionella quateirensis]STY16290.1 Uncharacterised protein [Legionella quateirensis]
MAYNQTFFNECMEAHRGQAPGYSMICSGEDALMFTMDLMKYYTVAAVLMIIIYFIINNAKNTQNPEEENTRSHTLD